MKSISPAIGALGAVAFAACVVAAPAFAQRNSGPPYFDKPNEGGVQTRPVPPFVASRRPLQAKKFLASIKASAWYEKQASDLALERSQRREVVAIARRLLEHAQIASAAVEAAETRRGVPNVNVQGLSDMRRQNLEQLARLKDPNFSTRYVKAMVSLYQQWRQDLMFVARQDTDSPYRRLARQMLPRARINLADLQKIEDTRR